MSRSLLTVTDLARAGVSPIAQLVADATNKHYFTGNTGQEYVEIENSSGGSVDVTFKVGPGVSADGLTIDDLVIGVNPGTVLAGPFRKNTFNQNVAGDVWIDPSVSGSGLRFRAYRLTRTA